MVFVFTMIILVVVSSRWKANRMYWREGVLHVLYTQPVCVCVFVCTKLTLPALLCYQY